MLRIKRILWLSFMLVSWVLLTMITLFPAPVNAAVDASGNTVVGPVAARPKIGLALSGGGAKAAAHLGVIKYLEQNRIPIDYISGTSMGSFIAGLYAMGQSSTQIEQVLAEYDWNLGYNDDVTRDLLSVREKHRQDVFQIQTHVGFDGRSIEYPSGYVQGQGMAKLLRLATNSLPRVDHFDQLPIPYRAVATDIETMQEVVLERGDLSKVMQASMSIPGALTPVEIDGKLLVDGGMVNNLPVAVLREMGADIIIAVDIGSQLYDKTDITSAFMVLDQLSSSMTRTSANAQIAKLTEQDILLSPDIEGIGTADFSLMLTAVTRGEQAAKMADKELAKLSLSAAEYAHYLQIKTVKKEKLAQVKVIHVNNIEIITDTNISTQVLQRKLRLKRGDTLTVAQLEQKIDQLYAVNLFQKVDYSITEKSGLHDIKINVVEKSWGPGYVDFKFNIQESTRSDDQQQIGLQYTLTDLNKLGAEWRSEFIYGSDSNISTEFYSPIDYAQNYFFRTGVDLENNNGKLYIGRLNDPSLDIISNNFNYFATETEQFTVYADLGIIPFSWAQFAIGSYYQSGNVELIGTNITSKFDSQGWYFQTRLDSLDNIAFPTQGFKLDLDVYLDNGEYLNEGSDRNVFSSLDVRKAFSFWRSTMEIKTSFASYDGEPISPTFQIGLGGFQNLSGYGVNEITGKYKAFAALIYRHRVLDNNLGAFSFPLYVGGSLEQGNVWNDKEDISLASTLSAGSIFIGLDTGIGPVMLSYGQAEGGKSSGYLFIGNNF